MAIHPSAIVDPEARLHPTVEVGPLAVIEAGVELGEGCRVGPHAHVCSGTTAGARNLFFSGCVIGGVPQDLRYGGAATRLVIGDDNTFREHVTVSRSNRPEEDTVVGSRCFVMANAHIAHNCRIGDRVIMANGCLLGGHVEIADGAFLSGNCLVHQFVRVGALALMQGGAGIGKDLPPFCIARGRNELHGLNVIGMRRAGMGAAERLEIRRLYHAIFRSEMTLGAAVEAAVPLATTDPGRRLIEFVRAARRGILTERRGRHGNGNGGGGDDRGDLGDE